MLLRPRPLLYALPLLLSLACKDPETVAVQTRTRNYQSLVEEGRGLIANGSAEHAVKPLSEAASLRPKELEPLLLLAEAHRQSGNSGAAILALKQAAALGPDEATNIKLKLADYYRQDGLIPQAIETLLELRDEGEMGDIEILMLARLQARQGLHAAAFETLDLILRKRPDDVDAKVVEAEILLRKGEEVEAAGLMDRLLEEQPGLTLARLLRARYFLNNGYAELAEQDLAQVKGDDTGLPDVVVLQAQVLGQLGRLPEAETLLAQAMKEHPQEADLIAQLAETKLQLGQNAEAQALVDQVLRLRPRFARALYVRGRALEAQGDLRRATEDYDFAVASDPGFAPALSRLWRLYRQANNTVEAMNALERLLSMSGASPEEKVALAELYAETATQPERGLKLIDEALRRDPDNARYKEIRKTLAKAAPKKKKPAGPIIIRGGRH